MIILLEREVELVTKFFNLLANVLFPVRKLILLCCFLFAASIVYLLGFSSIPQQDIYLVPSLLLFLWSLVLHVLCHSFFGQENKHTRTPHGKALTKGMFTRLKQKLARFFLWIYSVSFFTLILVSLYLTIKIIRI